MNLAPLDWALGDDLADEKPCGVAVLDAAGRLIWCNETSAAHFGMQPVADRAGASSRASFHDPAFSPV